MDAAIKQKMVFCFLFLAIFVGQACSLKIGILYKGEMSGVSTAYDRVMSNFNTSQNDFRIRSAYGVLDDDDVFTASRKLCDQLQNNVTTVVVSGTSLTSTALQSLFKSSNVPYISTSYQDHCQSAGLGRTPVVTPSLGVSLMPDYVPAIAETIDFYKWPSFIFIYDSDNGPGKLQRLLSHKYDTPGLNMRYAKRITNSSEANQFLASLESVDRESKKHVILDCSFETAKQIIIAHVRDLTMGRRTYHFFITQPIIDELNMEKIPEFAAVNITAIRMTHDGAQLDTMPESDLGQKQEWSENGQNERKITLEEAMVRDAATLILKTYKELKDTNQVTHRYSYIFDELEFQRQATGGATCSDKSAVPQELGDIIGHNMRQQKIQGKSGLIVLENGCRKNYVLDVVQVNRKNEAVKIGQWRDGEGFKRELIRTTDRNETKLNLGRTYVFSIIEDGPYFRVRKDTMAINSRNEKDRFEGFFKDLVDELAKDMGIQYEIRLTQNNELGRQDLTVLGGYSGMLGELMRHEVDVGLTSAVITADYHSLVDLTQPFTYRGVAAVISKKSSAFVDIPKWFTFIKPFSCELWIVFCSSFGVTVLVMLLVSICSSRVHNKKGIEHGCCDSIYNSLCYTVDAFTPHYIDSFYARSIAGRIIANFWWIFIILVFSSYTAMLSPIFEQTGTNPAPFANFSYLAQKTDDLSFAYTRDDKSAAKHYFKFLRTKDQQLQNLANLMSISRENLTETDEEGVMKARLANGSFVFFMDSNKAHYEVNQWPCDLELATPDAVALRGISALISKGSYLRHEIDMSIARLAEAGTLRKLQQTWWNTKTANCTAFLKAETRVLKLENYLGVFALPAGGIAIGFVVAILEIITRACTRGSRIRQLKQQHMAETGDAAGGFSNIEKEPVNDSQEMMAITA